MNHFKTRPAWLLAFLCLSLPRAQAQTPDTLRLATCHDLAKANFPAVKKLDLIARTSAFDIDNAGKRFLPQLTVSGQATYQSETVRFPDALSSLPIPVEFPTISKDQYRIQAEISQMLYDGGHTRNQKDLIAANAALQEQNVEVNLYTLKKRVNNVFFGILLLDAQLEQNALNRSSLQTQLQKTEAALANGVAFRSNVAELQAEILNIETVRTEFEANRTAYLRMLALLIGRELSPATRLELPENTIAPSTINRPELRLYDLQKSLYDVQEKQLKSDYMPQVNAFFQGAYGRPTLNLLNNGFGAWYIAGIRFNWSLGSLYSLQNKRQILALQRQSVDTDRATFLFNSQLDLTQQDAQVQKYVQLIARDQEAISLRQSVTQSAEAQLTNGVITTHEYIQKLNAEHLARQTLILHQMQWLQAQYDRVFISGN